MRVRLSDRGREGGRGPRWGWGGVGCQENGPGVGGHQGTPDSGSDILFVQVREQTSA